MDKAFLVREVLTIARAAKDGDFAKRIIAMTHMFQLLDSAIESESHKPWFDLYVAYAEANLIWNICYSRLSADGIFFGNPYSYQNHLDGKDVSVEPLFEVASYN